MTEQFCPASSLVPSYTLKVAPSTIPTPLLQSQIRPAHSAYVALPVYLASRAAVWNMPPLVTAFLYVYPALAVLYCHLRPPLHVALSAAHRVVHVLNALLAMASHEFASVLGVSAGKEYSRAAMEFGSQPLSERVEK